MTGFDFIFALFSLLLGLAMAEVLAGFARVMKLHARARAGLAKEVRVGALVPLLALFVLVEQLTFWTQTFALRDHVPFNYVTLVVVTAVVGGYYLLASIVWPEEEESWRDYDVYYDQQNRLILVGNLVLELVGNFLRATYAPPPTPAQAALMDSDAATVAGLGLLLAIVLNVALIFVRGRRLNVALLVLLIALRVGGSIAGVAAGLAPQ